VPPHFKHYYLNSRIVLGISQSLSTGRTAQEIRLLIFEIVKKVESQTARTSPSSKVVTQDEKYGLKAAVIIGKCRAVYGRSLCINTGKAVVQIAAVKTTITNNPLTCKPDPHMLHPHERKS